MIAIVDYGLGNLRSVAGAVERVGFTPVITDNPETLAEANKLILPGVGAFGDGMRNLRSRGLDTLLTDLVVKKRTPILGICLGFQLMAQESYEFGHHQGLGWLDASIRKMPEGKDLRLPHVGWNDLFIKKPSILFDDLDEGALYYYVHSFYMDCHTPDAIIGECSYGEPFVAAVHQDNIYGTQFHPEKSQKNGLGLLMNFLEKA